MSDLPIPGDDRSGGGLSQGSEASFGQMIPIGGGDPIPLLKRELLVGRRESCDIVLRFANVSAHHCRLFLDGGYWYVKDLKSRNGTRINGIKITQQRIEPADELWIARQRYQFIYSPIELGAVGPPADDDPTEIFSRSLIDRLGLERRKGRRKRTPPQRRELLDEE